MSDGSKRRRAFPTWTQLAWIFVAFLVAFGVLVSSVAVHAYHYQSSDGGFVDVEIPEKGRTFQMVEQQFAGYRAALGHDLGRDVVLCRTSEFETLPWWKSSQEKASYAAHPRWKLPYRPPTGK